MPREVSSNVAVVRLQPAQPNGYETQAYPFAPADEGETYPVPAGQALGMLDASKLCVPFDADGVAGEENMVGLNEYEMVVDDEGRCWFGDASMPDSLRAGGQQTAPVFIAGVFDSRDCTGLDADAIASWGAETLQNGFIRKA